MKKSDRYLKIVEWSEPNRCYVGRLPGLALGGVHGEDETEVYKELCEVLEQWLEIHERENLTLPPPTAGRRYSGKFNLRVGEELHERLAIESAKAGQSLNRYCITALREKIEKS